MVIALTHMRFVNDKNLIEEVKEIDLVLGGHDHHYHCELVNDEKWIIKSGTDFREFSLISVDIEKSQSNVLRSSILKIGNIFQKNKKFREF
jgi:5'-nucleotidase